jgi:outer membrane protein assembly factor BamB
LREETALEGGFGGAAVSGDEVFVGDRVEKEKDMLLCLDFRTGREKWRYESPSEGEPSYPGFRRVPTVEDNAVSFLATFGEVFRINRKTGKELWNTGDASFMGRGASLYFDDILMIQDRENEALRFVDPSPKEFKVIAEANIFGTDSESKKDLRYWSPLALSEGKLLLRGQDNLVYIDLKN